jgi:hypothetical protein
MKKLTPKDKKSLSYENDRRNRFGQNAKASRKLIPLRKSKSRRSSRHAASTIAREAVSEADGLSQIRAEARALVVDKRRWQKVPDVSLKDALSAKREWRVRRFGRKNDAGVSDAKLTSDPEGIL